MSAAKTILDEIVENKFREVSFAQSERPLEVVQALAAQRKDFRSLAKSLAAPGVQIIAEIKRRSPSKGVLSESIDPKQLAQTYERGGAAALSVLTDLKYFGGTFEDLKQARSVVSIPVLRKEFIVTDYQVYESAADGADAILLIVRILDEATLTRLFNLAYQIGLEVLLEIHDQNELPIALKLGAPLVGINNRNLASFHTDIQVAQQLAKGFAGQKSLPIALSGIANSNDIQENLRAGIRHFLVGESLVKSANAELMLKDLKDFCDVPASNCGEQ